MGSKERLPLNTNVALSLRKEREKCGAVHGKLKSLTSHSGDLGVEDQFDVEPRSGTKDQ